jgi:hypothetical protein
MPNQTQTRRPLRIIHTYINTYIYTYIQAQPNPNKKACSDPCSGDRKNHMVCVCVCSMCVYLFVYCLRLYIHMHICIYVCVSSDLSDPCREDWKNHMVCVCSMRVYLFVCIWTFCLRPYDACAYLYIRACKCLTLKARRSEKSPWGTHLCAQICVYVHVYIHIYIYLFIHTNIYSIFDYIRICICIYVC